MDKEDRIRETLLKEAQDRFQTLQPLIDELQQKFDTYLWDVKTNCEIICPYYNKDGMCHYWRCPVLQCSDVFDYAETIKKGKY